MVKNFDILIVGGGLTGAALALALKGSSYRIALVEPRPPKAPAEAWDARIYAFSPGNVRWLKELGAWAEPARTRAVHAMRIFGDAGGRLEFYALAARPPGLALVADNRRFPYNPWQ